MLVSVIISTYNGAHKILNVLRAVEKQTFKPDEVIVVIDGSIDNTTSVLEQSSFSFTRLKIIEQENGGRAKVRNRGVNDASGDLLVFFDDDMRPSPDCLKVHVEHHQLKPGSILTGAQLEEIKPNAPDMIHFKAFLSNKWSNDFEKEELAPLTKDELFITAANFSVSKHTFEILGGFDESLNDAEDYDLAVRAFYLNIPLYVNLKAHAWHDDILTCRSYVKRLRQYAMAHQQLNTQKPDLHQNNRLSQPEPKGLKRIAFVFFANKLWIDLVDKNFFIKILPRELRYKLYDIIVTANGVFFPNKVKL